MPTIKVLNQLGAEVKEITLDETVFGAELNMQVVYDVVNAERAAKRQGTHKVKGRSEVSGGGKNLGDKKELVVLVKELLELHNGVVVVSYLVQLQEVMKLKLTRKLLN